MRKLIILLEIICILIQTIYKVSKQLLFIKNLLLAIILILMISCHERQHSEMKTKSIVNEIRSTIVNYYNDIRKKGMLAEFKYLDNSSDFFWVPPGYSSYITYDSVVAVIKRNAPLLRSVDNSFDKLLITPLTDKHAQFTMRTHSVIIDTNGKISKISFLETGVMIRRVDGWKFLSGQTSILNQ